MGKLKDFSITFENNPMSVYYNGQSLAGTLIVDLKEPIKLRHVRILIRGRAYTHWTDQSANETRQKPANSVNHFESEEIYIFHEIVLWTPKISTEEKPTLAAGRHEFKFSYILPQNCPSSFESRKCGFIRYYVKGVIDRPWKFDHTCKAPFSVVGLRDLNLDLELTKKSELHDTKTLGNLVCFKSGYISQDVTLSKRGFILGENINITVNINNASSRRVIGINVSLHQEVVFLGARRRSTSGRHHAYRTSESLCENDYSEEIAEGESKQITFVSFRVPPIPPTLTNSSIIKISYFLTVRAKTNGQPLNLSSKIPIVIGTIPLKNRDHIASSVAETESGNLFQTPTMNPDSPSTSLEECPIGVVDIRESEDNDFIWGNLNYTPVYPCLITQSRGGRMTIIEEE